MTVAMVEYKRCQNKGRKDPEAGMLKALVSVMAVRAEVAVTLRQFRKQTQYITVLDLAGMELAFSTAACMMLSFAFVTKTVFTAHPCFGCCWTVLMQSQGLLSFTLCPPSRCKPG